MYATCIISNQEPTCYKFDVSRNCTSYNSNTSYQVIKPNSIECSIRIALGMRQAYMYSSNRLKRRKLRKVAVVILLRHERSFWARISAVLLANAMAFKNTSRAFQRYPICWNRLSIGRDRPRRQLSSLFVTFRHLSSLVVLELSDVHRVPDLDVGAS